MPEVLLSRRDLVRSSALAMTAASYNRVLGANDQVQLGVIGVGNRGTGVMGTFQQSGRVQVISETRTGASSGTLNRARVQSLTLPSASR